MIKPFLDHLRSSGNCSPQTIASYKIYIRELEHELYHGYGLSLDQATADTIHSWIITLSSSGISHKSIDNKISVVKRLYRFLHTQNLIPENPTENVTALRVNATIQKHPATLEDKDAQTSVQLYLDHLKFEKALSKSTILWTKSTLNEFESEIKSSFALAPESVTDKVIKSWFTTLSESGKTLETINVKLYTIKRFYNFLKQRDLINTIPTLYTFPLKAPLRTIKRAIPISKNYEELENIKSFVSYLKFERRKSENTIISYRTTILQFNHHVLEQFATPIENASIKIIRSWVVKLSESNVMPRSINQKLNALKTFYKFLMKRELITKNPTAGIYKLKQQKRLPNYLDEKQIVEILDSFEYAASHKKFRSKLIFEFLYGTGARLSELINLKESHLDIENDRIKVTGKGDKERIIPIPNTLSQIIRKYIEIRNRKIKNREDYLIVSDTGKRTDPMLIWRTINKNTKLFSHLEKRHPHLLRHTYATHLLNRGANILAIKDLLGHSSLDATQVYTHINAERMRLIYSNCHPKA